MATFSANKKKFNSYLSRDNWQQYLPEIISGGNSSVSPLFSLLPLNNLVSHRAAYALGQTLAKLALTQTEKARIAIRRFMWHLSEESGNIGWGIPFAFSESLAASPLLAQEYRNILISYIIDLGYDDNYCDNDILRRSCYWAIGNFAAHRPDLAEKSRPWLIKGLEDRDNICKGMAAWALGQLKPDLMAAPLLRKLADAEIKDECEIYENHKLRTSSVSELAKETLNKIESIRKEPRQ